MIFRIRNWTDIIINKNCFIRREVTELSRYIILYPVREGIVFFPPLIRKINLLKRSVTPRGIFCLTAKEEEREREISFGLWDFNRFFSPKLMHLYPCVRSHTQPLHKLSTGFRLRGVRMWKNVFQDTWNHRDFYLQRPAPRRVSSRSRTSSLPSDLLCF